MVNSYDSLPDLTIPADKAKEKVRFRIEKGHDIRKLDVKSEDDLAEVYRQRSKWSDVNTALLTGIFSDKSIADEYDRTGIRSYPGYPSLSWQVPYFRRDMDDKIARLESVLEKIDIIVELCGETASLELTSETEKTREAGHAGIVGPKIFIVHGTDPTNARYQLKDLLTEWGLNAVILHEQPNRGRTIIEKFVEHSDEVGCAIILLTPDDEGRVQGVNDWKPRARQNVVFELGFFIGKLGRGKVICLHKDDIELPSDIKGIVYIPFDKDLGKNVYRGLRRELKDIGFSIND